MEITKLPKWAQALLTQKDRQIRRLGEELEARRALAEAQGSELLSPSWDSQGAYLDPHHFNLPVGSGHVRYILRETRRREDYIDARLQVDKSYGRYVDIHGSSTLRIQPVASNSVLIFCDKGQLA